MSELLVLDLQGRSGLGLEASDSEGREVVGGHFSQAELAQELTDDWSKLEAVTWRREDSDSERSLCRGREINTCRSVSCKNPESS